MGALFLGYPMVWTGRGLSIWGHCEKVFLGLMSRKAGNMEIYTRKVMFNRDAGLFYVFPMIIIGWDCFRYEIEFSWLVWAVEISWKRKGVK
jgi:hypothetical protein